MDRLSPHDPTQKIVVMKGAQVGLTETALNFILYVADHNPAPILYVQKTIEDVEKFSKQRLTRSIELIPSLNEKIGLAKSRDSSNTIRIKNFPGGILILGGANSASSLRSMPIQYLLLDEEDSYDEDINEEGSPSELAIRRTANFPRRKILHLSTPVIRETSRIEPGFMDGDQRYYHVPCPFCGYLQVIRWPNMKWEGDDAKTIQLECQNRKCGRLIDEHYKTHMFKECEDYDDPKAQGARWIATNEHGAYPSYHISALYSPLGFFSWKDSAAMFIKATRTFNRELLKVFVNTVLGETWTESGKEIEAHWIAKRKETYATEVPDGVLVLTAGIDVQEDRIEVEMVGWGRDLENWSVDYSVFMGDTEGNDVWTMVDQYLYKQWTHASGQLILPACVGVDSGHRARVVYTFCRDREFRRIFPVKGQDGFGKGYIRRPVRRNQEGVWLFTAFVDELKSRIYSQLQIADPGPGYCHFPKRPEYSENYFRMLTAERLITVRHAGRRRLKWELPKGRKNEALDCRAYATAALNILNPNFQLLGQANVPLSLQPGRKARRRGRVLSKGV